MPTIEKIKAAHQICKMIGAKDENDLRYNQGEVLTLSFDFQSRADVGVRPKKNSRDSGLGREQIRNVPRALSKYSSSTVEKYRLP